MTTQPERRHAGMCHQMKRPVPTHSNSDTASRSGRSQKHPEDAAPSGIQMKTALCYLGRPAYAAGVVSSPPGS